ncbi:Gfo/Idh/MocA family oxidoreductase [Alteribacillus sp. JSM 102045]|uniref:Gfo/Idh/MocA family oxidoreductase n=1 Tax=Alteribacillus sp. JSM 102045 TaxID=1562101 RepID=UPI0035C1CECF
MKAIKIGVAGVGTMGMNHCKTLQTMGNGIDFVGVYDKHLRLSKKVGSRFNVKSFSSYEELLKNVDAVIIATSTTHHFPLIKQAIKKNKHILVEKPFVISLEESKAIKSLLKNKELIFQVGHIERFNPAVQHLFKVAEKNKMVSIEARRSGQVQRNVDIDVILNLMIHDIDVILALAASPIKTITAEGVSLVNKGQLDVVYAVLSFENGIIANITANRFSKEKKRLLTITEKERVLKTNCLTRNLYIYKDVKSGVEEVPYNKESVIEKVWVPRNEPLHSEINHFVESIQQHCPPIIGLKEAALALEVALKIRESALND